MEVTQENQKQIDDFIDMMLARKMDELNIEAILSYLQDETQLKALTDFMEKNQPVEDSQLVIKAIMLGNPGWIPPEEATSRWPNLLT